MKRLLLCASLAAASLGCQNTTAPEQTDRDNTAVNKRDADGSTKTPFDQSNEDVQIDLVAKLRSQILEIEDLSTDGRNIKIVTEGGQVTLRGPVASQAEHDAILSVVKSNAGGTKIVDQLEIDAN